MADGYASSYLPALSRLMGEVESPTQTGGLTSPQFGGTPEQLQSILQSPQVSQHLAQYGIHFDPSQVRQSPFFPNQFMQGHPGLGGFLNRGLASMAATPEAPMVSGWGSGLSRFAQGAAGGPEMLRQYQIRQMLAPQQALGMQIPVMEFERKQQLLNLLTQMERDRAAQANRAQTFREGQPQRVGNLGMIMPGAQVPQEMQGQPEHVGSDPLFKLFAGQGQQQFPAQQDPYFKPFMDPRQLGERAAAEHPERGATADLKREQAKTEPSKRELNKAKAGYERARTQWEQFNNRFAQSHGGLKPADLEKYGRDYTKLEQDTTKQIQALERASKLPKGSTGYIDPQDAKTQIDELNRVRTLGKQNYDNARGVAGASSMIAPQGLPTPPPAPSTSQQGAPKGGPAAGGQNTKPAYRVGNQWFDATTHQPIQVPQQQ